MLPHQNYKLPGAAFLKGVLSTYFPGTTYIVERERKRLEDRERLDEIPYLKSTL